MKNILDRMHIGAGILGIFTNSVLTIFSPLYETGIWKFVVPILGFCFAVFFVLYLRKSSIALKYSVFYGVAAIVINGYFFGDSSNQYGEFSPIMITREGLEIVLGVMLLLLFLAALSSKRHEI